MEKDVLDSWAEYYDLMYSGKEDRDRDFYIEQAKKADGSVLEIGVGTGRIYLELLAEDVDAHGIDLSEEMLEELHEKAEERGLEPQVERADMRDFDLDQEFELIIIPFRTFLHNLTSEEQISTLESCREHLEEDGKLILNFFYPTPEVMVEDYGEDQEMELGDEYDQYRLVDRTEFSDPINQIVEIQRRLWKGDELVWETSLELAQVYKKEFELLLRQAGFSDWEVYGGFEMEPLESTEQEMVWIARP